MSCARAGGRQQIPPNSVRGRGSARVQAALQQITHSASGRINRASRRALSVPSAQMYELPLREKKGGCCDKLES
jgi:hypothetical protein